MTILSNKISKEELKPGDHIYSWRQAYIYAHHGIYIGDDKVIHFTRGGGQEIGTGTVLDKLFSSSFPIQTSTPCPICGDKSNTDGVILSCLDCFLSGGELYLFPYSVTTPFFLAKARGGTCTMAESDPPDDVLFRAHSLLRSGFGVYSIFKNNCEDFSIYCKTGLLVSSSVSVGRSGQVTSYLATATMIVSSPPLRFLTTRVPGLTVVGSVVGPVVGSVVGSVVGPVVGYCVSRLVSDMGMRRDVMKVPVERLLAQPGLPDCDGSLVKVKVKID